MVTMRTLNAFVAVLLAIVTTSCSNGFSGERKDAPAGVYPAGELSGNPIYHVTWTRPLYRVAR